MARRDRMASRGTAQSAVRPRVSGGGLLRLLPVAFERWSGAVAGARGSVPCVSARGGRRPGADCGAPPRRGAACAGGSSIRTTWGGCPGETGSGTGAGRARDRRRRALLFEGLASGVYRLYVDARSLPEGYLPPWRQEVSTRAGRQRRGDSQGCQCLARLHARGRREVQRGPEQPADRPAVPPDTRSNPFRSDIEDRALNRPG